MQEGDVGQVGIGDSTSGNGCFCDNVDYRCINGLTDMHGTWHGHAVSCQCHAMLCSCHATALHGMYVVSYCDAVLSTAVASGSPRELETIIFKPLQCRRRPLVHR
jgi:hypothetical protein